MSCAWLTIIEAITLNLLLHANMRIGTSYNIGALPAVLLIQPVHLVQLL